MVFLSCSTAAPLSSTLHSFQLRGLIVSLKLIHLFSAGIDNWASHPILALSKIPITTSSGVHAAPIAEWAAMTTLVASRQYLEHYEGQKRHYWGNNRKMTAEVTDWVGKTVGVAGYGSIGRQGRIFSFVHETGKSLTSRYHVQLHVFSLPWAQKFTLTPPHRERQMIQGNTVAIASPTQETLRAGYHPRGILAHPRPSYTSFSLPDLTHSLSLCH